MPHPVISIENLSKSYRLGVIGTGTFYGDFKRWLALRAGRPDPYQKIDEAGHARPDSGLVWALKDVSFSVEPGEALGIIGRNGAGKSTLLKILSRVTAPTSGVVRVRGRLASLLEVGTGFHPELTGRENIFLNGAIMGMDRAEVARKFDEIVDFSGVERFIDTPVKRYSSGMYVRLAFSVAAHLDPDILIVDEVLAVGDAAFQKKCLGKMGAASRAGRTVLFVSHNMHAIRSFCSKGVLLANGRVDQYGGDVNALVNTYLQMSYGETSSSYWENSDSRFDNPWFLPEKFYISDENGNQLPMPVPYDSDIWICIRGRVGKVDPALVLGYALLDNEGTLLYKSFSTDQPAEKQLRFEKGQHTLVTRLPYKMLNEGIYHIELKLQTTSGGGIIPAPNRAEDIKILLNIEGLLTNSSIQLKKRRGLLLPILEWKSIKK